MTRINYPLGFPGKREQLTKRAPLRSRPGPFCHVQKGRAIWDQCAGSLGGRLRRATPRVASSSSVSFQALHVVSRYTILQDRGVLHWPAVLRVLNEARMRVKEREWKRERERETV